MGMGVKNTYNAGNIGHLERSCIWQVYAPTGQISNKNLAMDFNLSDYIDVTTLRTKKVDHPIVLASVSLSSTWFRVQISNGLVVAKCVSTKTKQSPWLSNYLAPCSYHLLTAKSPFAQTSVRMPNIVTSASTSDKPKMSANCEGLPTAVFYDPLHPELIKYDRELLPYVFENGPNIITDPSELADHLMKSKLYETNRNERLLTKFNLEHGEKNKKRVALIFDLQ